MNHGTDTDGVQQRSCHCKRLDTRQTHLGGSVALEHFIYKMSSCFFVTILAQDSVGS